MKNPNGYGSITKLKRKNLRKPYNVRITVDIKNGKQVRKSIGYFSTKQEALHALETYQANKYNVDFLSKTFQDLWQEWAQNKLNDEGLNESTKRGYIYAEKCITDDIKKKKFVKLKFKDYQDNYTKIDFKKNPLFMRVLLFDKYIKTTSCGINRSIVGIR